jgi:hypothetical protein
VRRINVAEYLRRIRIQKTIEKVLVTEPTWLGAAILLAFFTPNTAIPYPWFLALSVGVLAGIPYLIWVWDFATMTYNSLYREETVKGPKSESLARLAHHIGRTLRRNYNAWQDRSGATEPELETFGQLVRMMESELLKVEIGAASAQEKMKICERAAEFVNTIADGQSLPNILPQLNVFER